MSSLHVGKSSASGNGFRTDLQDVADVVVRSRLLTLVETEAHQGRRDMGLV
jgi:hypothetical protein